MMYVAEEAARFLHHACRGLPVRADSHPESHQPDRFCGLAVEYALGYFGARVLYPARSSKDESLAFTNFDLSLEILRSDGMKSEALAKQVGYKLGSNLYDAYLEGSATRCALRRLFLAELEKPGAAKEICLELANGFRSAKKKARAATV
jgi:hypothetical protein